MTGRGLSQRNPALLGAALFLAQLLGANLHLVALVMSRQPECLPVAEGPAPARLLG